MDGLFLVVLGGCLFGRGCGHRIGRSQLYRRLLSNKFGYFREAQPRPRLLIQHAPVVLVGYNHIFENGSAFRGHERVHDGVKLDPGFDRFIVVVEIEPRFAFAAPHRDVETPDGLRGLDLTNFASGAGQVCLFQEIPEP